MHRTPILLVALAALGASQSSYALAASPGRAPSDTTAKARPAARADSTPAHPLRLADTAIVRGLYVNRWAAQSAKRMRSLIAIADSTEVNALVIDMKDEFGLNFTSKDPLVAKNAGRAQPIANLPAMLDTLRAHHIISIARLVTFKDSVAARVNPQHTIRTAEGAPWRDKKGLTWVNPYDKEIWEYDIRVAEEMARAGFDEIQFDYIRFPEPYKSLPTQVFPGAGTQGKPEALNEFFRTACPRIRKLGARCTADIFGLVTTVPGALEVGQSWDQLAPVSDVLLPMVYPSHYPHGSFTIPRPNAEPYKIVNIAIARAHTRDLKLGVTAPQHVRPWLQAFTLGQPHYGAHELEEQKRAVYDAGYEGWVLWNPGSLYEPYVAGLEKTAVSREKPFGTPLVKASR